MRVCARMRARMCARMCACVRMHTCARACVAHVLCTMRSITGSLTLRSVAPLGCLMLVFITASPFLSRMHTLAYMHAFDLHVCLSLGRPHGSLTLTTAFAVHISYHTILVNMACYLLQHMPHYKMARMIAW